MRQKLIDLIDAGADIEFSIHEKRYTILPWTPGGITIGEQGSEDDDQFPDADTLLDRYEIDGVPLNEMLDEIQIDFSA